jgi:uncharacterized protein YaaN involved in tellurite resistance
MGNTNLRNAEDSIHMEQKAQEIFKTKSCQAKNTYKFCVETQRKLGQFSNEMLTKVKAKDASEAGEAINELLSQINLIKIDEEEKRGFLSRLPFAKKIKDRSQRLAIQ